jgi:hypothetical protein
LLAAHFQTAAATLSARGIELRHCRDLRRLVRINEEQRASWPLKVPPALDPDQAGFANSDAFMVEGRDRSGVVVFTEAARLLDLAGTNLKTEMEALRLFYRDPERQMEPGEKIEVNAPTPARISGRVGFLGAIWIRPDHRGTQLSRIFTTLVRWYAFSLWHLDWTAAIIGSRLVERGVERNYGLQNSEPGIRTRTRWADGDWHLISQSRAQIERHIAEGAAAMAPAGE